MSERGRIRCDDPLGNLDRHGGTDSGQRAIGNDPHSTSGRTARKLGYDPGQNGKQRPWGEKCLKKKGSERGCENCRDRGSF